MAIPRILTSFEDLEGNPKLCCGWSCLTRSKFEFWLLFVQAPITEEVVFRACILTVYDLGNLSRNSKIFLSPLSFGVGRSSLRSVFCKYWLLVAHAHHAWNTYNEYGRTSAAAKRALFSTRKFYQVQIVANSHTLPVFQLAYTTLFGFYAAFLFTKTGSIYPTISAHIFCNIMGVPQLGSELHQFPRYRLCKKLFPLLRKSSLIHLSFIALSFAYGIGLFGFIVLLGPWSGNTYYSWHVMQSHGLYQSRYSGYGALG